MAEIYYEKHLYVTEEELRSFTPAQHHELYNYVCRVANWATRHKEVADIARRLDSDKLSQEVLVMFLLAFTQNMDASKFLSPKTRTAIANVQPLNPPVSMYPSWRTPIQAYNEMGLYTTPIPN